MTSSILLTAAAGGGEPIRTDAADAGIAGMASGLLIPMSGAVGDPDRTLLRVRSAPLTLAMPLPLSADVEGRGGGITLPTSAVSAALPLGNNSNSRLLLTDSRISSSRSVITPISLAIEASVFVSRSC